MNERERKYRYWYNKGGGYTYSEEGSMEMFWAIYEADSYYYTLEDYINIKTHEGEDLYEGDIIMSYDSAGNETKHFIYYDIEFSGYRAKYIIGNGVFGDTCSIYQSWVTEFQKIKIGNIHQNPDLLK